MMETLSVKKSHKLLYSTSHTFMKDHIKSRAKALPYIFEALHVPHVISLLRPLFLPLVELLGIGELQHPPVPLKRKKFTF